MAEKLTVAPEDITNLGKQLIDQLLSTMSMEDRLRGVPHHEMLKRLSPEEIEHYLQQQKQQAGNAPSQKSPTKKNTP